MLCQKPKKLTKTFLFEIETFWFGQVGATSKKSSQGFKYSLFKN